MYVRLHFTSELNITSNSAHIQFINIVIDSLEFNNY